MTNSDSTVLYKERVLPSLAFFLALLFLPLATIAVILPFSNVLAIICGILSYILATVIIWRLAPLISINQDSLRVGKALIEVNYLGAVSVVESQQAFVERGRNLNPKAYTRF